MNPGSLMLAPQTTRLVLAPSDLRGVLGRVGLIGEPLAEPDAFLVGDEFLQLVGFMGCSAHVELAPGADGGEFCHVRLLGPFDAPRLLAGANTRPPRCPECRKPFGRDWAAGPVGPAVMPCPHCGGLIEPERLGWRHTAGLARQFVQITSVFPGEALPQDHLMATLGCAGIGPWVYFHVQAERFLWSSPA